MTKKRNPYIVGPPISEPSYFYGRQQQMEDVLGLTNKCLCLMGLRRSGKTSFLKQVALLYNKPQEIAIYLNLQGNYNSQLMGRELHRMIQQNAYRHPILKEFRNYRENDSCNIVVEDWIDFCQQQNLQSLLLIDEPEELVKLDAYERSRLRNLLVDQSDCLGVVISGSRFLQRLDLYDSDTSPFFNGFIHQILGMLDVEDAKVLINQRGTVDVEEDLMDEILKYCGQSPYLIQYFCRKLFNNGSLRPIKQNDLILQQDQRSILENEFKYLSLAEQQIMQELSFDEPTDFEKLLNKTNLPPDDLQSILAEMDKIGLVKSDAEGYAFPNIFWQKFINKSKIAASNKTPSKTKTKPERIFISYHPSEYELFSRLKTHLTLLPAEIRSKESITPGDIIEEALHREIDEAKILIALASSDYLADAQTSSILQQMKKLHLNGKTLIPIISKPCSWELEFEHLQVLPRDKTPISGHANLDTVLHGIAQEIRNLL